MAPHRLSRQQRRKIRRDSLELGRKVMKRGLGPELKEDEALGIALVLQDGLLDATRPRRAAEAAAAAEALMQASIAPVVSGLDVGCRKGCSFCCSALVTCSAPEVFHVAHWLRDNAGGAAAAVDLAAVAAEGRRRHDLAGQELFLNRAPCPLLLAQACGIYPARPIACRALFSMSSEACRLALEEGKGQVPVVAPAMDKGEMVRTLLLAAVAACGLPDRGIELTAGVTAVLATPDAETRWLAGEDVFADVLGAERKPAARTAQDHVVALVRSLAD